MSFIGKYLQNKLPYCIAGLKLRGGSKHTKTPDFLILSGRSLAVPLPTLLRCQQTPAVRLLQMQVCPNCRQQLISSSASGYRDWLLLCLSDHQNILGCTSYRFIPLTLVAPEYANEAPLDALAPTNDVPLHGPNQPFFLGQNCPLPPLNK